MQTRYNRDSFMDKIFFLAPILIPVIIFTDLSHVLEQAEIETILNLGVQPD